MSRVDWTPYEPGDPRDVSPWNTAMQSLVTESTDLDATNFAQEGLLLDDFAYRPREVMFSASRTVRDTTGLTSTSWADFSHSAVSFNFGTNFTLGSNQELKIRYRVFFSTRQNSDGRDVGVDFRIGVKRTTELEDVILERSMAHVGEQDTWGWVGGTTLYQFEGEIDYVRLQYQLRSAGTIRPHYSVMYGMRVNGVS